MPELCGFTSRNFRYMRIFYEEWEVLDADRQPEAITENVPDNLELINSKLETVEPIWKLQFPNYKAFPIDAFLHDYSQIILGVF